MGWGGESKGEKNKWLKFIIKLYFGVPEKMVYYIETLAPLLFLDCARPN